MRSSWKRSTMKKVLKYIGLFIVVLIVGGFIAVKVLSEPLPEGKKGAEAEALADQVLLAINDEALDTTTWLTWEFIGGHTYVWNQSTNTAKISWVDNDVIMQLDEQSGKAMVKGVEVDGEEKEKLMQTAWSFWCNDSFWLMAPNKVKDLGTVRSLVDVSDEHPGKKGLLVAYESGGVTPGDSYLWIVDENNMPIAYKMWVSILPVKGVYVTWGDWMELPTGAKLATTHDANIAAFGLSNVRGGQSLSDIGLSEAPF